MMCEHPMLAGRAGVVPGVVDFRGFACLIPSPSSTLRLLPREGWRRVPAE